MYLQAFTILLQIVVMTKLFGDGWLCGKSLDEHGDYLDGRFPERYVKKLLNIELQNIQM